MGEIVDFPKNAIKEVESFDVMVFPAHEFWGFEKPDIHAIAEEMRELFAKTKLLMVELEYYSLELKIMIDHLEDFLDE